MSLYVDLSALLKRHLDEPDSLTIVDGGTGRMDHPLYLHLGTM